jgi:hypothetical protein
MKKLLLTALLILGLSGLSFAYTPVNTGKITQSYQKNLGGLITPQPSTLLLTEASFPAVITGLSITAAGTATQAAIYDYGPNVSTISFESSLPSTPGNANLIFEATAAANTTTFYDFSQTPIRTVYGIEVAIANVTGGGVELYTVQYP